MKYYIKGQILGNNQKSEKIFKGKSKVGFYITVKDPIIAPYEEGMTKQDVLEGIKEELGAFTPKWVDKMLKGEKVDYINLSSQYPAKVSTSLNIPDDSIIVEHSMAIVLAKNTYHNAIKVLKNGEEYDPFRGSNMIDWDIEEDDAQDTIPDEIPFDE